MDVYLLTNKLNGKKYVGVSKNYLSRWKEHQQKQNQFVVHKAISKYGADNFIVELLDVVDTYFEAFDLERKFIIEYNSIVPNGYNMNAGGSGDSSPCEETVIKIKKGLKERWKDPNQHEQQRLIAISQHSDSNFKLKMNLGIKKRGENSQYKENHLKSIRSDKNREVHRKIALEFWAKKKGLSLNAQL